VVFFWVWLGSPSAMRRVGGGGGGGGGGGYARRRGLASPAQCAPMASARAMRARVVGKANGTAADKSDIVNTIFSLQTVMYSRSPRGLQANRPSGSR
jgi:hypothetical protein